MCTWRLAALVPAVRTARFLAVFEPTKGKGKGKSEGKGKWSGPYDR
jgi:hypothetical protein